MNSKNLADYELLAQKGELKILSLSDCPTSNDNKFFYKNVADKKIAVDVTHSDNMWIQFHKKIKSSFLLTTAEKDGDSYFILGNGSFLEKGGKYYLELVSKDVCIDFSSNNRAYKIFFLDEENKRYAVDFESVSLELPNDDVHVLCVDFGTSSTSAGTWSDTNENPELVEFDDVTDSQHMTTNYLFPTTVYIRKSRR